MLLLLLPLTLSGCKKAEPIQQNTGTMSPENSSNEAATTKESIPSESPQETLDQQNSSGISPEESKEVDEFYQLWNQEQINLNDSDFLNYYSLIRENADTLMIYLDGSGYDSVMGVKDGDNWIRFGMPCSLATYFSNYDFLTMEKINVKMGGDHFTDPAVINNYTFDNRVSSAVSVIDSFLSNTDKDYKEIILFGISQGGRILPRVYSQLSNKDEITRLITLGSGGLSQYEDFMILKDSNLPMESGYKKGYAQIEEVYPDILENPDSVEKKYFGHAYKMWYGFLSYNPMGDFVNINIPVLVLHGSKDTNDPVESARALESEFQKKGKTNLTYMEYADMRHCPESKEQVDQLLSDMESWLQ